MVSYSTPDTSRLLTDVIQRILDSKKALDIVSIDLAGKSDVADYMIIASGTSSRHVATLADYVTEGLKEQGIGILSVSGKEQGEWVLVDTPYVIVHLFRPEMRTHYNLEKMWQADFSETTAHEMAF